MDRRFKARDIDQIRSHGLTPSQAARQLAIFEKGPGRVRLLRPATVGDGILELDPDKAAALAKRWDDAVKSLRPLKFVPASGAASRMFKALFAWRDALECHGLEPIRREAEKGDASALLAMEFMENIRGFALWPALCAAMDKGGKKAQECLESGDYKSIFQALFTEHGLGYANTPKGLILFHSYEKQARTAFEEHIVEGAAYATDGHGTCRLHFTVAPRHLHKFKALLAQKQEIYEAQLGVKLEIGFSIQDPATDTLAVTPENKLFRNADGSLLLRPGGHGALLKNLDQQAADIIFINNIDNVVCDKHKPQRILWKKALAGLLVSLQEKTHKVMASLERGSNANERAWILDFCCNSLGFTAKALPGEDDPDFDKLLFNRLHRPIRVCGMVKNQGEPGGAPFWVLNKDGTESLQIVESAQVRADDPLQAKIFRCSTHFNPVDLVCAVRDHRGLKFDLEKYVDQDAVFIADKSKEGRSLKALELPGLWNGSMAGWISIFVDVPMVAFNPAKTINDLLRPLHRIDMHRAELLADK